MADYYLWLKAVHVIAMVAWMAGMLYLPRLFVYHAEVGPGTPQSETFKVMERRLLRFICTPAMIVVWITGLWLAYAGGWFHCGLAAWQDPARGPDERRARHAGRLHTALCRGRQPAPGTVLSHPQ